MSGKIEKRRIVNMRNKIPRILLFVGLLISIWLIAGCSTKDPWQPTGANPVQSPLRLTIQSGPDTSMIVPGNTRVTFTWTASGGTTKIEGYSWYLEPDETAYGEVSQATNTTYLSLPGDSVGIAYTFHLRVSDGETTVAIARDFTVSDAATIVDSIAPTIYIDSSMYRLRGAFLATGSHIGFSWKGNDGNPYRDILEYQYSFSPMAETSAWTTASSAVFNNIPTSNTAIFWVRAKDAAGNISDWDSLSFVIKPASILYVDDFVWLDALGNPDINKEIDQKQFYRDALDGYAFAEWDVALQGLPDSALLVQGGEAVYSSIIFCSDSDLGNEAGSWADTALQYVMRYYLSHGGHLLITGAFPLLDMNYDPANGPTVTPGTFQFDWLGIDSVEWCYDYWNEMTWVIKDAETAYNLPDSMKIDVAKNGTQLDYATSIYNLQANSVPIFTWGLTIDASTTPPSYVEGDAYGVPVGYITSIGGGPKTALLGFDTYSMPKPEMTQTFRTILTAFGE
jgi:hypothetical protein